VTLCPLLRRLSAEHARWRGEPTREPREDEAGRASRLLALWDEEILPHCRAEEDVLLPELARRLSEADAAVVFTLGDHVVLRQLARALRDAAPAERPAALAAFEAKLHEHTAFEERNLFPALQETLGCDRLATLATEIARSASDGAQRRTGGPSAAHDAGKGRK
jgi:iron-sulfur cluster repair protein YtfE (RIC family)